MTELINTDWLWTIFWSIIPVSELRGGIPYALAHDLNPVLVYFVCVISNVLAYPIVYLFLDNLHPILERWEWYRKIFDKFVIRTRRKVEKQIDKYGFWGLMIFVMIPLPVTGAYTGSLAAWLFNINKKKGFLAVLLGVIISGIIVTTVFMTGAKVFDIFMKRM